MFFRRKDTPPAEPTPSWLKWVLIAFLLLAVINYQKKDAEEKPGQFRMALDQATEEMKPNNFFDYSQYKEKVFPSLSASLQIDDVKLGSGLPVVCGQEVAVGYEAWLDKTHQLEGTDGDAKLRYIIGEGKVMPVFEHGVIGMQPGGVRSIITPMKFSYGAEGFKRDDLAADASVVFNIVLHEVSPPLPNPDKAPYRIAVTQGSSGKEYACGETVRAMITVWDMHGKQIYTTYQEPPAPLSFRLGASQVFVGLEQGVVGMREGEMRTLVVPPSFQKPLRGGQQLADFHLPANETVLVDVTLIP